MADLLTTYNPTKVLLQIEPNLSDGTFNGRASRDLQFTSVRVARFYEFNEGYPVYASVDVEGFTHDTESEVLTIPLDPPSTPESTENGFYIALEYTGAIGALGETGGIFAVDETTLEANLRDGNAHRVFPSYQGGVYTKFWLTVITDERTRVESNLDDAGHQDFDGKVKNNFSADQISIEDVAFRVTPIVDME
ncbi:unnamed protein product [Caenorhabditis sp. 36 PRJEB53466]|nr:unnamed protein product [Caenorhabditis sp. 36 PRJEB53466]